MVLHTSPYPSACLNFLDGLSWILVFPCYWLLDRMLGSCVATSLEKRRRQQEPCSFVALYVLVSAPLYLLAFLLALPVALLGFLLWAPVQAVRQPYVYTYHRIKPGRRKERKKKRRTGVGTVGAMVKRMTRKQRPDKHQAEQGLAGGAGAIGEWRPQGRSFCFCSANVCLLPDSLARFNNLSDTQRRAREVGKRIRNGASRPQIKIYIDSPTNTSISAASFSSLATGFRRTSSLDQRPDHATNGPADCCADTEPLECPIHPDGAPDCPLHNTAGDQQAPGSSAEECALHPEHVGAGGDDNNVADCPLHSEGDHTISDCPVHVAGGELPDCPMHHHHQSGEQGSPDHGDPCAMHQTGAQNSPEHNCDPCPAHQTGAPNSPGHHDPCPMHQNGKPGSPGHNDPCPMHQNGAQSSPGHSDPCPMHQNGAPGSPGHSDPCPMHQNGAPGSPGHRDPCPMHEEEEAQANPSPHRDCPLHASGVQISISAPEPEPPREDEEEEGGETGNHRDGDVVGGMYPNNTLSHVPRMSVFRRGTADRGRCGRRRHGDGDGFDHDVSAFFPANLDFLALQEVFDHASTARLRRQLHRYFPYVLSDVGRYGWKGCCSRFKFLNSGLLLASRYPILDVRYECYPNGRAEDALAAKGALFAKVHVGTAHQDQRVVGFITTTHLHAIEADAAVRCEQLDLILQWGAEFRQSSCRRSAEGEKVLEDLVAFDVLLGDLNFDNCSSEDKLEQQHALFTQYKDPCRLGPGEDKPWALGTLLDQSGLYDEEVNSPESLQKVMENEEGRKEYLVFPPSKGQSCHGGGVQKGRKIPLKGNGRRIDYILYSDEGLQPDWKLDIEEYSFVTQLAGLTDHLSVAARLAVSTGEEES